MLRGRFNLKSTFAPVPKAGVRVTDAVIVPLTEACKLENKKIGFKVRYGALEIDIRRKTNGAFRE